MSPSPKSSNSQVKRSPFRPLKRFFLRQFPRRKAMVGGFLHRILGDGLFDHRLWKPERTTLAAGLAVGLFIGLLPTYWVQIIIAVVIAFFLKVNITASVVGTAITNPFTTLPIVGLQYKIGLWLVGPTNPKASEHYHGLMKVLLSHGKPYLIGSFVTAVIGAVIGYLLVILFWKAGTKIKTVRSSHGH
jgi:uncharacterized protein